MSKNHQNFVKKTKILCFSKYFFSMIKKIFFIQIFFADLEFSYTFDLTYFESPRRCTETSRRTTLTGRTGPEKSIFDEFLRIFKDFRCILACTPIVCLQKSDQSQFSKNSNSKKKIRKFSFFLIQSLCLKVTRKIIQHIWGPLGTCFPSRFTFS